jgi:short subunit dehydrogenase-like uncharacterized protein
MRYSIGPLSMSASFLLYGATGYSGGLVARHATARGWRPILCGRDPDKLAALGRSLRAPHRVASIADPASLDRALEGIGVVLNAAGPFSRTTGPVFEACLRAGAHYLDLSAEVPALERLAACDGAARARGVMAMPAVGFDVVATDCLAVHVARRLPGAVRLAIAVTNLFFVTRGSAKTLLEAVDAGAVRENGRLVPVPLGARERTFDYADGPRASINVSLADLTTAYHSTGIPNIETYTDGTPLMRGMLAACRGVGWAMRSGPAQAWLTAVADLLPADPAPVDGDGSGTMAIVAEVDDGAGRRAVSRLRTPEAYAFTPLAAMAVLERVLGGDHEPGFQTPARVYGADLVLGLPGVVRQDLA